jgi:hypothetical protein
MPKKSPKSTSNDDSVSMIVNIDQKSKKSSETLSSKTSNMNDPQPRDGDTDGAEVSSANDQEVKETFEKAEK